MWCCSKGYYTGRIRSMMGRWCVKAARKGAERGKKRSRGGGGGVLC